MVTPKRLIEGSQLTGAAATYYTAPALTKTRIRKLTLNNTTGGAVAVTVYLVPSGGAAGVANAVWSAQTIAAGAKAECYEAEGHVLEAGDFISALGLSVTIQASGDEIA
jgi:Flp pilus assembly protein TadD